MPNTDVGPVLASVDAGDDAISFYAYRDGGFVRLNGSLSTGSLPAQIIAAQLNGDGLTDLVIRDAGDGSLWVYFGAPASDEKGVGPMGTLEPPTLLARVILPVGLGVSNVQAIDTSGDGRLDLVVTNELTGQVSVLLNSGDDTFAAPVPYRTGTATSAVDAGDTPEVTSPDATTGVAGGPITPGGPTALVTINPGTDTIGVLGGLGNGRFADPASIDMASPGEIVRMGDFTGDGLDDLAVLGAGAVSIYLADGHGGFLPPRTYAVPSESDGLSLVNLTGNGKLDLLVGDAYGDVLVLMGNGDGTFSPYREANQAVELAVADLSGDGAKDIIYADQGLDRVVVDYGASQSAVLADQSTGLLNPGAVAVADLNGDGIKDLIVADSGSNNVLIYPGLGDGQFGPGINGGNGYFVGTDPVGDHRGRPHRPQSRCGGRARSGDRRRGFRRRRGPRQRVRGRGHPVLAGGAVRGRCGPGVDGDPAGDRRLSQPPGQRRRLESRHDPARSKSGRLRSRRRHCHPGGRRSGADLPRRLRRYDGGRDGECRVERPYGDLRLQRSRPVDEHDLLRRGGPGYGLRVQSGRRF